MADLIDRRAAIENSFEVYTKEYGWCEVVGVDAINSLPPAQPDLQPTCNQLATNTISRQAAIDVMFAALNDDWELDYAKDRMCELPSAQREIVMCKDCKNWDTTWQNDWAKNYHYCPLIDGTRNGDWYCADAERREDE